MTPVIYNGSPISRWQTLKCLMGTSSIMAALIFKISFSSFDLRASAFLFGFIKDT